MDSYSVFEWDLFNYNQQYHCILLYKKVKVTVWHIKTNIFCLLGTVKMKNETEDLCK